MVEENEIRVGLSYYERARIVAKAVAQGVFETEKQALQRLFHTASRPKRSKKPRPPKRSNRPRPRRSQKPRQERCA